MVTALFRIFKFAWQDFWRNIWLSITTLVIITSTFISISFLFIFNDLTDNIIDVAQKKIDISIYLKNTVTDDQVKQFQQFLRRIDGVDEVVFVSREESLYKFRSKYEDDQAIVSSLAELGENPLGVTFIIRSNNVKNYPDILNKVNEFKNGDFIADKNFEDYQIIINKFNSFSSKVKQVGIFLSFVFGIISILIVFNTIRVSIYSHQAEIGVMKLVGATNIFIKGPYLMVGFVYTVLSALLSYAIFYPLVNIAQPYFWQYFEGTFDLRHYFFNDFIEILLLELVIMIFVNLIASSLAVGRYLKK